MGVCKRHVFYITKNWLILPESTVEIYATFFQKKPGEDEKMQFRLDRKYDMCTIEGLHLLRHK